MSALLRAELLKLRTTRTTWALLGSALVVVLGVLILVLAFFERGSSVDVADLLVLSLGIVGAAGEFRHGTITAALLVTPSRWPVVVAKAIAYAIAGGVYALATIVLCLVVALPWLAIKDASFDLGGTAWLVPVSGRILYAMFTAALGVGVGTLFRNQAAGLVTMLIYILALEPALGAVSDTIGTYGLNGSSLAMFGSDTFTGDALPFGAGVLVYFAYVAVFTGAGIAVLLRRDVS
jgi:ABC-2 type transport system permease protein